MNDPKPGWTVEAAVLMVKDGYTPERVAELSGFARQFLEAQLRLSQMRERERIAGRKMARNRVPVAPVVELDVMQQQPTADAWMTLFREPQAH